MGQRQKYFFPLGKGERFCGETLGIAALAAGGGQHLVCFGMVACTSYSLRDRAQPLCFVWLQQ